MVLDVFFRNLRGKGLPPEALAEGTSYDVALLRTKHERIDWDGFLRVMRNVGRIWTPEELIEIGAGYFNSPYTRPFAVVARLLFSAKEFYRWVFAKQGVGDQNFTCVENSFVELGEYELRLDVRMREGYTPCPEFFTVTLGNFIGMPQILGLSRARVEMALFDGGARYHVHLPPGGGLLGRVKKAVLWPFTVRAAAEELKEAHEALLIRYQELDQARSVLADQAEQLQTVNALGKELARVTELNELGDSVMKLLTEHFACTGASLWMVWREGAPAAPIREVGVREGAAPRSFDLLAGGHLLGRIEAWGYGGGSKGRAGFELDVLLPWISIALENARSFALLRETQNSLEQKVSERTAALKKSHEELEEYLCKVTEMDQQKTEFFANASHELRTPLTLMLAPLESVVARPGLESQVVEEIRSVLRGGYRLMKLVNDLLDLSKLEAGKMKLRIGPTDLARLLDEVVRPWRVALQKRGVALELALPPSLLLTADVERLEQVALNLISNAVKHVPDKGWIRVEAGPGEGEVYFSITNSGEGIDPEDLPRLFDRFAQSSKSRARRFGSTGLGLPVVRELVELHGGRIEVVNSPGQSVCFRVALPASRAVDEAAALEVPRPGGTELLQYEVMAEPESAPVAAEVAAPEDKPVLLIAEDNADLRSFLSRSLKTDFNILEAADGLQALQLVRERLPDIILSDLMMPELDGIELCKQLRAEPETMGIPFVLLTARGDMDAKLTGLLRGADDYLVKPFHLEEVRTRLRVQLRLRAMGQQLAHREKLAALGTLVAGVAHEIRNPLNGIINSLMPLKEMLSEAGPDVEELLDLALHGARRVDAVSAQLLRQARSGEGLRTEVDLAENLTLALQMLSHKVASGPRVETRFVQGEVLRVVGEPGALNQVWINLIDNAIQAAGPQGVVSVSLERSGQMAQVEVADNGPGIPPQVVKRIFDPFFTTKPVGSGTGLGLSLVREIVRQHGGDVTVQSRPGEGARFRVTLPATFAVRGDVHAQG